MLNEQDKKRREEFKEYEMKKEHDRQERRKTMSEEEKKKDDELYQNTHNGKHEKVHEPVSLIITWYPSVRYLT